MNCFSQKSTSYLCLAFFVTSFAWANSARDRQYEYSLALDQVLLYSKDTLKYFFSENFSKRKTLPGKAILLRSELQFTPDLRFGGGISIPTEFEILDYESSKIYFYPKSLTIGFYRRVYNVQTTKGLFDILVGGGLNTPLSENRMGVVFPSFSVEFDFEIDEKAVLDFGIFYAGSQQDGVLAVPFGIIYKL